MIPQISCVTLHPIRSRHNLVTTAGMLAQDSPRIQHLRGLAKTKCYDDRFLFTYSPSFFNASTSTPVSDTYPIRTCTVALAINAGCRANFFTQPRESQG